MCDCKLMSEDEGKNFIGFIVLQTFNECYSKNGSKDTSFMNNDDEFMKMYKIILKNNIYNCWQDRDTYQNNKRIDAMSKCYYLMQELKSLK